MPIARAKGPGSRVSGARVSRAIGATALGVAVAMMTPASAHADPDAVALAQQQMAQIQAQASQIDSDYTAAQSRLDAANAALTAATHGSSANQAKLTALRQGLSSIVLNQFQSAGVGATAQLLTSPDDTSFLSKLGTMQNLTSRASAQLQQLQQTQTELSSSRDAAQVARDQIADLRAQEKTLAASYAQKLAAQQAVVDRLSAQERARLDAIEAAQARAEQAAARQAAALAAQAQAAQQSQAQQDQNQQNENQQNQNVQTQDVTGVPASGRAATAVQYALARVGKAYVMGATGPDAYDCSGLMLRAWEAAGIELPRTSQEQINVGTPVAMGDLQPGDLVFYYPGITHVGMYIGGGMIVNAENPRVGVKVAPLTSMPVMGARRVG